MIRAVKLLLAGILMLPVAMIVTALYYLYERRKPLRYDRVEITDADEHWASVGHGRRAEVDSNDAGVDVDDGN